MKKFLLIALLLLPLISTAKGSPASIESNRSSIVDVAFAQRILMFQSENNAVSANGIIVACQPPNISNGRDGTCLNHNKENAWVDALKIDIPGYSIVGFEHRWIGSNGYRQLLLYFSKK